MKEKNVAKNYANSLYQIGKEFKVDMAEQLTKLTIVINENNNLENVLFLNVFNNEEKADVLKKVCEKININKVVLNSMLYLIEQRRVNLLPLIIAEIIKIDDDNKGFIRGYVEGSDKSCDQEFLTQVKKYLKQKLGKEAELEYKNNDSISAGYKVTVGDIQFDATVENQLQKFKESILG